MMAMQKKAWGFFLFDLSMLNILSTPENTKKHRTAVNSENILAKVVIWSKPKGICMERTTTTQLVQNKHNEAHYFEENLFNHRNALKHTIIIYIFLRDLTTSTQFGIFFSYLRSSLNVT